MSDPYSNEVATQPEAPSTGDVTIAIEADDAPVGQGRVVDPDALGTRNGWPNGNSNGNAPM